MESKPASEQTMVLTTLAHIQLKKQTIISKLLCKEAEKNSSHAKQTSIFQNRIN